MNKKYLTFLSAILISTILACGGSQSGDAPRHQNEPKSDPVSQSNSNSNSNSAPATTSSVLTVKEVNELLQKWTGVIPEAAMPQILNDSKLREAVDKYHADGFEISFKKEDQGHVYWFSK